MKTDLKQRPTYLNYLRPHIGKNVIKVLVGLRRSGKSYLMLSAIGLILKDEPEANIIYVNKEHYEFDHIKDYHSLQTFFDEKFIAGKKNYFFVDEVQEIEQFEKCLRNIFSKKQADIFISGSNSEILSGDIATMLSGRYVEINVHPLSYPEFLNFFTLPDTSETFYQYLRQGGMPGLLHVSQDIAPVNDYLKGILSTVVLKDIVSRYNIRNVYFLENLTRYISDNLGSLVSSKNISDYLKSQRVNISPNLVMDYLKHLCSAYITNKVLRMEISGKKIFEVSEKYYFEDLGLRNTLTGYNPADISKLLENVVYNHLIIAGYRVYIGQKGVKEIDFVAEKNGETIYIQVCYALTGENVIEREFGNLLSISDNYKKYVVSMDNFSATNTYKGIEHMQVKEFCKMIVND